MLALPLQPIHPRNPREKAGFEAESQLAHYLIRKFEADPRIDLYFGLRLPLDRAPGTRHDAVQIDALLIHPHGMAIIESKSVYASIRVNTRNEWSRTFQSEEKGMPSPVEQVERQADALRNLLNRHKTVLRERKLLGLIQGGFKACPIECFVAVSDNAVIHREHPDLAPEVMKADQIARRIEERINRHRTFGGTIGIFRHVWRDERSSDGLWDMTPPERENIRTFLLSCGSALLGSTYPTPKS